jgi:hypothetical protein
MGRLASRNVEQLFYPSFHSGKSHDAGLPRIHVADIFTLHFIQALTFPKLPIEINLIRKQSFLSKFQSPLRASLTAQFMSGDLKNRSHLI